MIRPRRLSGPFADPGVDVCWVKSDCSIAGSENLLELTEFEQLYRNTNTSFRRIGGCGKFD